MLHCSIFQPHDVYGVSTYDCTSAPDCARRWLHLHNVPTLAMSRVTIRLERECMNANSNCRVLTGRMIVTEWMVGSSGIGPVRICPRGDRVALCSRPTLPRCHRHCSSVPAPRQRRVHSKAIVRTFAHSSACRMVRYGSGSRSS